MDWIWSIEFSPDGSKLISSSDDRTIKIWDKNGRKCIETLDGHLGWIWSTSFSRTGAYLVSGSQDQTIKLWDLDMKKCMQTIIYRLYSNLLIQNVTGLTKLQKEGLKLLGAIES